MRPSILNEACNLDLDKCSMSRPRRYLPGQDPGCQSLPEKTRLQFHIGLLAEPPMRRSHTSTPTSGSTARLSMSVSGCLGNGDDCGIYCIVNAAYIIAKPPLPKLINVNFWRLACRSACAYGNAIVAFSHTPCRPYRKNVKAAVKGRECGAKRGLEVLAPRQQGSIPQKCVGVLGRVEAGSEVDILAIRRGSVELMWRGSASLPHSRRRGSAENFEVR